MVEIAASDVHLEDGTRVEPSEVYLYCRPSFKGRQGVVVGYNHFGEVRVLWDGYKIATCLSPSYVRPVTQNEAKRSGA